MRNEHFAAAMLRATGGLILWAAHFTILYGVVGLACARGVPAVVPWTAAIATLLAVAGAAWLTLSGLRRGPHDFLAWLTAAAAASALVAIVWQALPVLLVPWCA